MVISGRRDPLSDPKGHGVFCGPFDLVYDRKRSGVIRVAATHFMTPKFTVTVVDGLT